MSIVVKRAVLALAAASACSFAGEDPEAKEEKPAVELGGYVTVDYGTDLTSDADPSFGIGEVDLSANVNISPEVVASITVMTYNRLDSLWIDQAMVAWTPSLLPVEFLFGQQTMNHGLLTTRLISDPLLLDDVELVRPSVILNGAMDMFTAGFGFTILSELDELNFDTTYRYSGVVNIDANLPNESLIRLSSLANGTIMDVDLAGTINFWKCAFDFEAMATKAEQDSVRASGVYAGLLYDDITDRFSVALRGDGVSFSDENFKDIDMRVAGGVTIKIKDGIFCAAEFARRLPSAGGGVNEIAVEVGLEQTIQLPGFQRKTLTRE